MKHAMLRIIGRQSAAADREFTLQSPQMVKAMMHSLDQSGQLTQVAVIAGSSYSILEK